MTGTAAWADLDTLRAGDSAACELEVTEAGIEECAGFSGDNNPLHMDGGVARAYGFPGRVAHGLLALAALSRLIGTRLPGPGSLWLSQEVQFAAPAFPGDHLQARVTVQTISKAAQVVVLSTEVINIRTGVVVLRGTARVRVARPRGGEG